MLRKEHMIKKVKEVVADLPDRAHDVLSRRFGLADKMGETLESIGASYKITRERVRQIENAALKTLKTRLTATELPLYLAALAEHLGNYGGVMEQEHLVDSFHKEHLKVKDTSPVGRGSVLLLLSADDRFKRRRGNDYYWPHWYLHDDRLKTLEQVVAFLKEHFGTNPRSLRVEDLKSLLAERALPVDAPVIVAHVEVSRHLGHNKFGDFGLIHWPDVRPKGVKDKAYLVMKNHGQPLHFSKVAALINEHKFSDRRALSQTVHNELIKDKRFVLVGRGIYGLREWGYEPGTVKDILIQVIRDNRAPMDKQALVDEVLKRRLVKANTVLLNLHNRREFERQKDGRYALRQV